MSISPTDMIFLNYRGHSASNRAYKSRMLITPERFDITYILAMLFYDLPTNVLYRTSSGVLSFSVVEKFCQQPLEGKDRGGPHIALTVNVWNQASQPGVLTSCSPELHHSPSAFHAIMQIAQQSSLHPHTLNSRSITKASISLLSDRASYQGTCSRSTPERC